MFSLNSLTLLTLLHGSLQSLAKWVSKMGKNSLKLVAIQPRLPRAALAQSGMTDVGELIFGILILPGPNCSPTHF